MEKEQIDYDKLLMIEAAAIRGIVINALTMLRIGSCPHEPKCCKTKSA